MNNFVNPGGRVRDAPSGTLCRIGVSCDYARRLNSDAKSGREGQCPLVSDGERERDGASSNEIQVITNDGGSLRLTVTRNYEASSKQLERNLSPDQIDYAVSLPCCTFDTVRRR